MFKIILLFLFYNFIISKNHNLNIKINNNNNLNPYFNPDKILSKLNIPLNNELLNKNKLNTLIHNNKLKNNNKLNNFNTKAKNYKTGFWTLTWRSDQTCDETKPIILQSGFRLGQCFSPSLSDDDNDDDDNSNSTFSFNNLKNNQNIHKKKQNLRTGKTVETNAVATDDDDINNNNTGIPSVDDDDDDDDFFDDAVFNDDIFDVSYAYTCDGETLGFSVFFSNDCSGKSIDFPLTPLFCADGTLGDDFFDDDDFDDDDDDDDFDDDDFFGGNQYDDYFYDDDSTFGSTFELGCSAGSQIKFDTKFLISGSYIDTECKEFSSYIAIRGDHCHSNTFRDTSVKISTVNGETQIWGNNSGCSGDPSRTVPLTVGECSGESRRLADDDGDGDGGAPKPSNGGSAAQIGTGVTTSGSTSLNDDDSSDDSIDIAVIIGAVVGGVVGCCILGMLIWYCMSRVKTVAL